MSSFDQVIKNILADIFAEEEQQEVTRPRARPEGLMSSTRPQARPEDVEPVQPSASESTSKFVAAMSDYDDTPEEGVEIPLAFFKGTARDLEGRYKTTGMQLAKLNKNRGDSNIRVAAVEEDTTVDDLIAELEMSMKPMLRPRARPKSAEEIQTIRAEQASYTKLDTVKDIQQALNVAGIEVGGNPLVVDGIKGRNTIAAIKAFQKREGLKVDGIVGKNTKAALYRVMPKPEIKEEELQPSIYDKPAQVGPDQMQVGFSSSYVPPERYRIYQKQQEDARDLEAKRNIPTELKDELEVIQSSMVPNPVSAMEAVLNFFTDPETQARTLMNAAPLASKVLPINAATFAEFLGNEGKVNLTSDSLSGQDYFYLRNKALEVIKRGDDKFTYNDWGLPDGKSALVADITKTAWGSLTDPSFRMATLIGQTAPGNVRIEDGRVIVEDVYDFNAGPRGRKLQKAFELKEQGDTEGYEKLSAEALEGMTHLGQLRVWAAALGVPQGEGTRFKLDLGEAP